jgi:hypothetical protein
MKEESGVRKDCTLEKKAKPMMYPTVRRANNHGDVKGRVTLMMRGSRGIE